MQVVRNARKLGGSELLWPRGCKSIEEVPHDLLSAIDHASRVCDWQENLPTDELPPRWMWPFEEELADWFEQIKEAREIQRGGGANGDTSVPMMSNEMAEGRG